MATAGPDTLHGKLSGVVINADVDKADFMHQIVDARGHRFPIRQGEEVIDIHAGIFPFCLPFTPIVLEIAKQFFLFTID